MGSISKAVKAEQAEALEQLRAMINPGATIFTTVRRVARSGMSRTIDAYLLLHDDKVWLSGLIARAGLFNLDRKSEALKVQGCGIDLGFHVVYETAHALFRGGFGCTGERCNSNDHSNGDRDYTPHTSPRTGNLDPIPGISGEVSAEEQRKLGVHWHRDGGYALRQRWL